MNKTFYNGVPRPEYRSPYFDTLLRRLGGERDIHTCVASGFDNPVGSGHPEFVGYQVELSLMTALGIWNVRGVTLTHKITNLIAEKYFAGVTQEETWVQVILMGPEKEVLDLEATIQEEIKSFSPEAFSAVQGTPLFNPR